MKKILCYALILGIILTLSCSCGNKDANDTTGTTVFDSPKTESGTKKHDKKYENNMAVAWADTNYFYELTEIKDPDNTGKTIFSMNYKGVMPEYTSLELVDQILAVRYPNIPGDVNHLKYTSDFVKANYKDDNGKNQTYWFIKGQVYGKTLIGIVGVEEIAYESNSGYEIVYKAVPVGTIVLIDAESKENKRLKGTFTAINDNGQPYLSPTVFFDSSTIDFSEKAIETAKVVNEFKRMTVTGEDRLIIINKILKDYGVDNKYMEPLLVEKATLESESQNEN